MSEEELIEAEDAVIEEEVDTGGEDIEKDTKEEPQDKMGITIEGSGVDEDYPPALRFLENYMPEKEDIRLKTRYQDESVPINISGLERLMTLYPELNDSRFDFESIIENWIEEIERGLVSVEGMSRNEYKEILQAMLSGMSDAGRQRDKESETVLRKLFDAGGGGE